MDTLSQYLKMGHFSENEYSRGRVDQFLGEDRDVSTEALEGDTFRYKLVIINLYFVTEASRGQASQVPLNHLGES